MLDALGEAERRDVLRVAVRRRFRRGEVVCHQGDPGDALHIVASGVFLARSASPFGDVVAVNTFGAGEVFGELALLTEDAHRTATIVALQPGSTLAIARSHFEALRRRSPGVDRFLVAALAERNRVLNDQLVELLFTPVEQRVYRRLLAFAAATAAEGWVPISQQDIASLAGTTRSTANRVLRRAEGRHLVELARGRVRIVDPDALRRAAGRSA